MERLLSKVDVSDPRVLLGPRIGEDVAVLDYGDRVLVAKSDPVTFATQRIGWYAVQVNANDVACAWAVPRWFLATLLVPENTSEYEAESIFSQILEACALLGVTLVGGHSEVTIGIDRPIVVGSMLGEAETGKLVSTGGAMPGDAILLTKGIAIEGTVLLAWDAADSLARAGVSPATIERAKALLTTPGISVVKEALAACSAGGVNSLHDPTEGGLATALGEIAAAAGVGLVLEEERVPVPPECAEICGALGLEPLGLLASGSLLITLPREQTPRLLSVLQSEGMDACEIGRVTSLEDGLVMLSRAGREVPLPSFDRDELGARPRNTVGECLGV